MADELKKQNHRFEKIGWKLTDQSGPEKKQIQILKFETIQIDKWEEIVGSSFFML